MTTREYSAAVIAERAALNRLQRLLRAHGSPKSRLDELDVAYAHWRQLAALLEAAAGVE